MALTFALWRNRISRFICGIAMLGASDAVRALPPLQSPVPHLFVDAADIDSSRGLALLLHSPERREVVLTMDAPWEGPESGYATVLHDGEKLLLYYRGGGESTQEVTCVAFSNDGTRFHRPELDLFDFQGRHDTNIVYRAASRKAYGESHNFTPFLDSNPAEPVGRRWKALAMGHHRRSDGEEVRAAVAMVSPDGLRWSHLSAQPVLTSGGGYDSQNIAFWDTARQCYAAYFREGRNGIRSVRTTTSSDFLHWYEPVWAEFGEPLEHFYTNAIQPYPRNPAVYIGLPMRFVPQRKSIGEEMRPIDGVSDAVLISSRDGVRFSRTFREAFIRPGVDPLNWGNAHGNNTPVCGMIQTSSTELSVYWMENYGAIPRVRRGVLRTDGFASLHAGSSEGELLTKPFVWSGRELQINYSTSAVGHIRMGICDEAAQPVPGFEISAEIYGDEISRRVKWTGDLKQLTGHIVRLHMLLKDADLYSWSSVP